LIGVGDFEALRGQGTGRALTARPRRGRAAGQDGRFGAAGSSAEALGMEEGVILVDTSAWIHHLRKADARLVRFLTEQRVRTTDVVMGELLLGSGLPSGFARNLRALPRLPSPSAAETRLFVERHSRAFAGCGVGWADVGIVLAAVKAGARLHTADHAVRKLCRVIKVILA
jgi:predicted nucleic acid-binding protein